MVKRQDDRRGRVYPESSADRDDQLEINDILLEHAGGGGASSQMLGLGPFDITAPIEDLLEDEAGDPAPPGRRKDG